MRNYEAEEYRRGYNAGIEAAVHAFWAFDGELKFISTSIPANVHAKKDLGTATRTYSRLRCSRCEKITLVDETICYSYCPHCGATMHYL